MSNRVFISAPISGFIEAEEYRLFRHFLLRLITALRGNGLDVCSEIEQISSSDDYSTPQKSVKDDFDNILRSDIFLFCHPKVMQTSSFIELGFACAVNKRIVIAGKMVNLPYLAKGLLDSYIDAIGVDLMDYSDKTVDSICKTVLTFNK